ncbi:hypothetical protein AGR2A_Cc120037 [Agrobacterium genomosp. 2 str. CFBP 5494]|uniref:Uncharacterized protein n=1 Tax=Agrobacterium genomosp. 2 str. CFBP 5494 TaxID=1183436 RepID=A0A9W5AZC7_9HYPH|nr:hypothetical protein AGR2A_Cc120037 [Agrobacterium genomosp. 2 str. CFBP 5494]
MRLTLCESDPETTDLGFQARDMADGAHGNATQLVSAAARLSQLACIAIGRPALFALFGGLLASGVRVGERGNDGCGKEAEFQACAASRIARVENRHAHTRYLLVNSKCIDIRTRIACEPAIS